MRFYHYDRTLLIIALVVTLFYSWRACAREKPVMIYIEEIHHHRGGFSPKVEAGTCMFYCNALPKVTSEYKINNDKEEYLFTLHNALLSNERAERKADDLTRTVTEPYTFSVKNVKNGATPYVVLHITYPKGMFSVQHKWWEQQNRSKKGLIFYLYNQSVIDALSKKDEPVLRTVSLKKNLPRIFIDSGHGGSDTGAVGIGNIQEKDICLCVGTNIAKMLHDLGYDVMVSRATDCDVPLDERTSRANSSHADIFVSIHANASMSSTPRGIETFSLAPTLFERVGERSDHCFADMHGARRAEQSKRLAHLVQKSICHEASVFQKDLSDRGVKHTVSHILVGTQMPTILVELGFVTNTREAELLASRAYQHSLARGIAQGIHAYCTIL
jgi:N-acetylmuramoyl-L-alanine amidase